MSIMLFRPWQKRVARFAAETQAAEAFGSTSNSWSLSFVAS